MLVRRLIAAAGLLVAAGTLVPTTAQARYSERKSLWGPARSQAFSLFGDYAALGTGTLQMQLRWNEVARRRPKDPTNPRDRAYRWPSTVDFALAEAAGTRVKLALTITGAPGWANGGRPKEFAPRNAHSFARFAQAAALRYPAVRYWRIWEEPSTPDKFKPFRRQTRRDRLTPAQAATPERYARLLDAAYQAIKRVAPKDMVIGGNSVTYGGISPRNWIRYLRLPDGRPPRMDLYGHSPYSLRFPGPGVKPLRFGFADLSSLRSLAVWVDRYTGRRPGSSARKPLWLARFFVPSDHDTRAFPFHVTRDEQARWLSAAYSRARANPRVAALGWDALYDDAPRARGDQAERGLLTFAGERKPAYDAFRRAR